MGCCWKRRLKIPVRTLFGEHRSTVSSLFPPPSLTPADAAMQKMLRLAILAVMPLFGACTVLTHAHVADGVSGLPYRDRAFTRAAAARVGFALDALPTWAFALSGNWVMDQDRAAYFEPKCFTYVNGVRTQTGCYPVIQAQSTALEVEKRWGPTATVHPLASASLGRVNTGNVYRNTARCLCSSKDSSWTSPFVTLGGGGELNIARWLHVALTAGYREVFRRGAPSGTVSPSGLTLTSLLIVGRPYR